MAKQNEVWKGVNSQIDLKDRIPKIVEEVAKKSKFIPNELLSTSSWWSETTGIGAFHFNGKFEGKPAILKVQGVKPTTSEIYMIESFEQQNKSRIVRPPHIYDSFPWDDNSGYEAFVLEDVGQNIVVNIPTNEGEVQEFFEYYLEYRKNCRSTPWIEKPIIKPDTLRSKFDGWTKVSHKIYPDHPLRKSGDLDLINKAVEILTANIDSTEIEFVHGHFSTKDLYKTNGEVVLLSNLYWSWRPKYYDLIFAYHWFMYNLGGVEDISEEKVEEQRKLWLDKINEIADDKKALNLVFLERAAAGLNLDSLNLDPTKPITKHLVGKIRKTLTNLIEELS